MLERVSRFACSLGPPEKFCGALARITLFRGSEVGLEPFGGLVASGLGLAVEDVEFGSFKNFEIYRAHVGLLTGA